MTELTNQQKLKNIRKLYQLTNRQIATLLGVKPHTVNCWFVNSESIHTRKVSNAMIELLQMKIYELDKTIAKVETA